MEHWDLRTCYTTLHNETQILREKILKGKDADIIRNLQQALTELIEKHEEEIQNSLS